MKCKVDDCEKEGTHRGLCDLHYGRWRRGKLDIEAKLKINPRGTGTMHDAGYIIRRVNGRRIYEHILLAEKALGRPLPKGARVHHTGKRWDNHGHFKLVLCPNEEYHKLLHKRMKELGYEVD